MKKCADDGQLALVKVKTRAGVVLLSLTGKGIASIVLPRAEAGGRDVRKAARPDLAGTAAELLRRYFSGEPVDFDLPLDLGNATAFQRAVWRAAAGIPYGETRSYAWIARRIGRPRAARAVGQALGANPVPVIIPCHRVISAAGTLGGFSGGLGMKQKLLRLEGGGPIHGDRRTGGTGRR